MKKTLIKLDDKDSTNSKLVGQLSKAEQAKSLCFDELAGVRLQVSSLMALQKSQKALESGLQVCLCYVKSE